MNNADKNGPFENAEELVFIFKCQREESNNLKIKTIIAALKIKLDPRHKRIMTHFVTGIKNETLGYRN